MDCNVAENINILAKFLGTRDIDALNQEELFKRYGIHQVDVMENNIWVHHHIFFPYQQPLELQTTLMVFLALLIPPYFSSV